ncbi:splicing factor 3B subunit 3 [Pseudoscourfieldia marina]
MATGKQAPMHVLATTLHAQASVTTSAYGSFSAPKAVEMVAVRAATRIDLLRPAADGTLTLVSSTDVFGAIRSLATFRLAGAARDYLVVGSDSGRVAILEYEGAKFKRAHVETFGRPGCRRVVPGQFVVSDPQGRAVMIAALEKQKIVYIMSRDTEARLTISSPLEASKSSTVTHHMCALDVGFDNPVFAALETDYTDADELLQSRRRMQRDRDAAEATIVPLRQKMLTLYELDLGTNHVHVVWSEPADAGASMLVAVPGGGDGPGGVLVMCEDCVRYLNPMAAANAGREQAAIIIAANQMEAVLPRRADLPRERGTLITCATSHKQKKMFFVMAQSEYGDLYKISLSLDGAGVPVQLTVKHFDTIPPCVSMHVLKTGFLFAASEFGDHGMYQFLGMGDGDDGDACATSDSPTPMDDSPAARRDAAPEITLRPLRNLFLTQSLESHAPITTMRVSNMLAEESPQIYALCGQGVNSHLKVMRAGISVTTLAENQLPGTATGVWTLKQRRDDDFELFILVSFDGKTMLLRVDETVEEVGEGNTNFMLDVTTMHVALLGDDTHVQTHPGGMRIITGDGRVTEWHAPGRRTVTHVASNRTQLVAALTGGTLVYFELAPDGTLQEDFEKRLDVTTSAGGGGGGDVACLSIAPVPEGQLRARFAAVGSYDNTLKVVALPVEEEDPLTVVSLQAVAANPASLLLVDYGDGALNLCCGLSNGVLVQNEVDIITGTLSNTRMRFLGNRPPRLHEVRVDNGTRSAMLALSSRTYLGYHRTDGSRAGGGGVGGGAVLVPVSCSALKHASPFSSAQSLDCVVAVEDNLLRIFSFDDIGERFHAMKCRIRYTGRSLCLMEEYQTAIVGCADANVKPIAEESLPDDAEAAAAFLDERAVLGPSRAASGSWASCVHIVDPRSGEVIFTHELNTADGGSKAEAEAASASSAADGSSPGYENVTAICPVTFPEHRGNETLVAVATGRNLCYLPRRVHDGGYLHIFRYRRSRRGEDDQHSLELVHTTRVKDDVPMCLCAFQGKLLVGVGGTLRLYDMGLKRLLRKCELAGFPTVIKSVETYGSRVYVADVCESVSIVKYRSLENSLYVVADDVLPRHMTACRRLDYDTVAGADKFGNAFVLRLNENASIEVDDDPTGGFTDKRHKLDVAAHFHVGDVITAMDVATLQPGGTELLLGATVSGAIRALVPFATREDADFFLNLELHLRQEAPPLCGRDHMEWRACYAPIKHVVDGDLIDMYASLPLDVQTSIAEELDRTRGDVLRRIDAMKNRLL